MPVYEERALVNGQKRYFIRTYVKDSNGKLKQITKHNKNWIGREGKKEAEWEEKRLQCSIAPTKDNLTLNGLFEAYFSHISNIQKPSTLRKTRDNYVLHIKNVLGDKIASQITTKDVLHLHHILDNKRIKINCADSKRNIGEHPLSVTYKKTIHITLNSILQFGCKFFDLEKNVASIVGNFKKQKGSVKEVMNFLTIEEFNKFIELEQNELYKDFFTILFYTGMRRGELLALELDNDVDFQNKKIYITKSLNPKNGKLATTPKTNKSNRQLTMLKIVYDILIKYKQLNISQPFSFDKIKPTTLQRKCDKNCKEANINKNIRIHDFRHSFATMCINNQVPIEVISDYLGHENISTTLDTYSHLYPNSQAKLINILDNILIKQDQKQDQQIWQPL